jgi:hypothetical protein
MSHGEPLDPASVDPTSPAVAVVALPDGRDYAGVAVSAGLASTDDDGYSTWGKP